MTIPGLCNLLTLWAKRIDAVVGKSLCLGNSENVLHYQIKKDYSRNLTVYMACLNWQTDQWEKVKIEFINVDCCRFIETTKISNSVIFKR